MRNFILAFGLAFGLVACGPVKELQTVSDAQTAVAATAKVVTDVKTNGTTPTLSEFQDAACAGQAIANAAGDMLSSSGYTTAAGKASTVSTKLGVFCP